MPFPEDGKTITISKARNEKDLMRIVITDTEGKETHFLLDGFDKVVGNLNKKNPRFMPPKFRYMTAEELDKSSAKLYINYANSELQNFAQYLEKVSSEGYKHFISIDFETKEFLKCDSTNGKPKIIKDSVFSYTSAEIKEYNIENKFNSYMEEIFRASKETDTPHEVTVLKLKENKATDDANKFADEYFKTFITQFKKAMSEKMSDFQSKLDELFKG